MLLAEFNKAPLWHHNVHFPRPTQHAQCLLFFLSVGLGIGSSYCSQATVSTVCVKVIEIVLVKYTPQNPPIKLWLHIKTWCEREQLLLGSLLFQLHQQYSANSNLSFFCCNKKFWLHQQYSAISFFPVKSALQKIIFIHTVAAANIGICPIHLSDVWTPKPNCHHWNGITIKYGLFLIFVSLKSLGNVTLRKNC